MTLTSRQAVLFSIGTLLHRSSEDAVQSPLLRWLYPEIFGDRVAS